MHRLALAALTLALVSAPAAAHADTMTSPEAFTASGNAVLLVDKSYGVASSSFSLFNTSLGTLNSISFSLSGTALVAPNGPIPLGDIFVNVDPANSIGDGFPTNDADGLPGDTLMLAASRMNSTFDLRYFEGAGNGDFVLEFTEPTSNVSANGTVTYNYTPAAPVAVTPEPSSFALLGTGILGMAGVLKRRFA